MPMIGLGLGLALHKGVGVRTTPLRIATFGDSAANFFALNNNTDVSSWNYAFTAGTQQITRQQPKTLVAALYGQAFMVANGGIGGESTSAMLARSSAGASATRKAIEDIIALNPDVVHMRMGINDFIGMGETPAATFARAKTLIDMVADAGIPAVVDGLYGYDVVLNRDAIRTNLVAYNALLASYSRSRYHFIETSGLTHDGTGAFLAGMDADDMHLSDKGGYVIGKAEAAVLRSIFGAPAGFRYPGTNLIPNADLSAFGSQAYGTVGTGWAVQVGNGTRANAKIETINGVVMQTVEITPTADNCTAQINAPFPVFGAGPALAINAGEVYGFEGEVYAAGLDGGAKAAGSIIARMELFTGTPRNLYGPMEGVGTEAFGEAYNGRVIWEPVTIPDFGGDPANLTSNCRFIVAVNGGVAGDRTAYKFGFAPRMVRLS